VTGTSLFGRVKLFHVREDILQPNCVIDQAKLQSMSRLGGISYGRCVTPSAQCDLRVICDVFKLSTHYPPPPHDSTTKGLELTRPVWAQESQREEVKHVLEHDRTTKL
jgi:hypothetical protein